MYRILLFLSLCLCVLSVPMDKKQSLEMADRPARSESQLLTYNRRQDLEGLRIIKSGPPYKQLLRATRLAEQALKNQVPTNTSVPKTIGGNDQTAQALPELLKYVPPVIRDMNIDPIALIRLVLHYKALKNQVPANTKDQHVPVLGGTLGGTGGRI
ncbi:uncharacterized protein BX664DRAFT_317720 [Halteromyces radiatus]|uniref:uncharacterized protein n=1 Tax=Halteromyces radiatus TaxID=101107 RepID=UPI00221FFA14|nr:uncharacterized protein BX664DRAFT_317720 [Halteromyces radiatus]KAI8079820.1 hypothetical protein BX664DRAFT_317720 [Halteromyces radiatus]